MSNRVMSILQTQSVPRRGSRFFIVYEDVIPLYGSVEAVTFRKRKQPPYDKIPFGLINLFKAKPTHDPFERISDPFSFL